MKNFEENNLSDSAHDGFSVLFSAKDSGSVSSLSCNSTLVLISDWDSVALFVWPIDPVSILTASSDIASGLVVTVGKKILLK